jgi:hypothetical protein
MRVPAHAKDAAVRKFFRRRNDVKIKESQFLLNEIGVSFSKKNGTYMVSHKQNRNTRTPLYQS